MQVKELTASRHVPENNRAPARQRFAFLLSPPTPFEAWWCTAELFNPDFSFMMKILMFFNSQYLRVENKRKLTVGPSASKVPGGGVDSTRVAPGAQEGSS